jgi:anti-sigma factor RsiW
MDCRKFRDKHALFVDKLCSELDASEMRSHMRFCPDCARHDTVVRRGIMLMRNLPTIEPSATFNARLAERLRAEHSALTLSAPSPLARYVSLAAAAAVLALGVARVLSPQHVDIYRMAPVVASRPQTEPSLFGTPGLVATVPTGMSIWPAIMMASQAPEHYAATELASER